MRIIATTILVLLSTVLIRAQWSTHYAMSSSTLAASSSEGAIAGNSSQLFMVDSENAMSFINKTNLLNDVDITAVLADGDELFVGYSNGNIDFVDLANYKTTNIPELKNHDLIEQKSIRNFYKNGNTLYCAAQCGIIEINVERQEITTRYMITDEVADVNDVEICGDNIYAATTAGLYCASLSETVLENSAVWTLCGDTATDAVNVTRLTVFNGQLHAAFGSRGGTCEIKAWTGSALVSHGTYMYFYELDVFGDYLCLAYGSHLTFLDSSYAYIRDLTQYNIGGTTYSMAIRDIVVDGSRIVVGDASRGLVVIDENGVGSHYSPNGPNVNTVFQMLATQNGIYFSQGGVANGDNLGRIVAIMHYDGDKWSTYTQPSWRDGMCLTYNPLDPDDVYLSTYGVGVYRFNNGQFVEQYTAANSSLVDVFGGNNYTRTSAMLFDDESYFYVLNYFSSISVRSPDGEWANLTYPFTEVSDYGKRMIQTSNGNIWLNTWRSESSNQLVAVFNTNGTPLDDSDDLFRCGFYSAADSRDMGVMELVDADGESLGINIYDCKEDREGRLWFASSSGVFVFDDDADVFDIETPVFKRIKVPRNDGTEYADYLLDGVSVSCIAVDGANRKWIGTRVNGVYFISDDGLETYYHFDINNSPLPSNEIIDIVIHPVTGEVFIGTAAGVVSYKSDATEPGASLEDPYVYESAQIYPNPVEPSFNGSLRINGLVDNSRVKILDITGRLVHETISLGGLATWNCKGVDGRRVASGVYLICVTNSDGTEDIVKKVVVM